MNEVDTPPALTKRSPLAPRRECASPFNSHLTPIFTSPKTETSKRVATIPNVLQECLREYMSQCFDLRPGDRLFPCSKRFLYRELAHGCKASGVKRIRIHDLRHSHASLLIEMGSPLLLITERPGHEHVQTTLETYGHLYPNKQSEVARQLDELKL